MEQKLIEGLIPFTFQRVTDYIQKNESGNGSVIDFKMPSELSTIIDLNIPEEGVSENEFLGYINKYLDYSVRTGHKQFLNQLYSGFNLPAFIGEVFTVLTNTSMYTYEVAPVATLIEQKMIDLMKSYAGYPDGDGIFVSGGSNANLVAMFSARNKIFPEGRLEGYPSTLKFKAFVNEHAHYSFETAANVLGIGSKNIVKIKSDSQGRMIPEALDKAIQASKDAGETPFFVVATCASTMIGAYDPIAEMADICQKHKVWLHADGAFGGSLILSNKHSKLLKGIEHADSFAWDAHKLMGIPLICSVILVKDKDTLYRNITDVDTDYLYHDIDGIEDLGKKSIQCGRRVDAVKLWFAWKYYGLKGYEKRIDNLMDLSQYAEEKVKEHPALELLVPRQSFTICFRYLPEGTDDVNTFNLRLREQLRKSGQTIVNYGYIQNILAIRLIVANPEAQKEDVDLFFHYLIEAATEMERNNG